MEDPDDIRKANDDLLEALSEVSADISPEAGYARNKVNQGKDPRYAVRTKTYPEFAPNEEELLELARYWITWALEIETFWFLTAMTGSFDRNTKAYANKRLDHIAEMVGAE